MEMFIFVVVHFTFVVYIEMDNSLDRRLFLSILTNSAGIRAFNMRVTQVNFWNYHEYHEINSTHIFQLKDSLAPNNCLQYYTDVDGWFQTFNYDDTSQFVVNRIPSYFVSINNKSAKNNQYLTLHCAALNLMICLLSKRNYVIDLVCLFALVFGAKFSKINNFSSVQ